MKLKRGNEEIEATNAFEIGQLKAIGYVEVKDLDEEATPERSDVNAVIADKIAQKEAEDDSRINGSPEGES